MRIVFIINSISTQRCIKRVEEFIAHGYEVKAYGFYRKEVLHNRPKHFSLELIGEYDDSCSYVKRIPILKKGIRKVLEKHKNEKDVVFYLFQLDVALVFKMLSRNNRYLYEESDLMHTYIRNAIVCKALETIDKWIIKHSLISVFTSEGFLLYHYGSNRPNNVYIVTNRLNTEIENIKKVAKSNSGEKLRIGFVGSLRYKSTIKFIDIFSKNFPQHEFHIYGEVKECCENDFKILRQYPNCFFHGRFINPNDLPQIYSGIDLVLSTYDTEYINVRYAEPNKLYEAIYFETPIIVSKGTYLETIVDKLGIGYCVNPLDMQDVVQLIKTINNISWKSKINACRLSEKRKCLNINDDFFSELSRIFNRHYTE